MGSEFGFRERLSDFWGRMKIAYEEADGEYENSSAPMLFVSRISTFCGAIYLFIQYAIDNGSLSGASIWVLPFFLPTMIENFIVIVGVIRRTFAILSSKNRLLPTGAFCETDLAYEVYSSARNFFEYPVGGSIPLVVAPSIGPILRNSGWAVSEVKIQEVGDLPEVHLVGDVVISELADDGPKFSLKTIPAKFSDALTNLPLDVYRTKFSVVKAHVANFMKKEESKRQEILRAMKDKAIWPNSLCLHIICETSDQYLIATQRKEDAFWFPGAFSISCEEQLAESDLRDGPSHTCEYWVRRAICEEIYPQLNIYTNDPVSAWGKIARYIDITRLWTLFQETEANNISLVCYIKLNQSLNEYCKGYKALYLEGGTRDREGNLFAIEIKEAAKLFGSATATFLPLNIDTHELDEPLYGDPIQINGPKVKSDKPKLHPSSLYRVSLLLRQRGLVGNLPK